MQLTDTKITGRGDRTSGLKPFIRLAVLGASSCGRPASKNLLVRSFALAKFLSQVQIDSTYKRSAQAATARTLLLAGVRGQLPNFCGRN